MCLPFLKKRNIPVFVSLLEAQIVERARQDEGSAALRVHTTPLLGGHSLVLDVIAQRAADAKRITTGVGDAPSPTGSSDEQPVASPKPPGFLLWLVLVWAVLPAALQFAGIEIPEHL